MNIINKLSLITLLLGCSLTSMAEAWSLDSCISYAISHNVDIRQQELRVADGELSVTEAKDRFLPTVDAGASQSFNFGRGLTAENTYANRNTSSTQWNVGFNLPLFQGMAEYRRLKAAQLSLRQYLLEVEATKDNLTLNVISQYLQVLYAKEMANTARSQAELSAFEVERQKALVEAGKVAEATLYDVESVAAQDRLQVVTSENEIQTALVNLANLLHIPSLDGFDVIPIEGEDEYLPTPDEVYSSAMGFNNAILGARQAIRVADENISYAKSGYIPTLSLNGGVGSSYYTVGGISSESFASQMRHNFSTYLGLSLRIPLFDGFTTRNNVRRAKIQKLNAQLALEQQETTLYKDIRLAYWQAKGARERWQTSAETLEKARLSFEATRERFNLGRSTQADYEQAKNNLFKTEVNRIQARYEFLIRHRILLFYSRPRD